MKDPVGKGIFFVNGRESGYLSVYDLRTKSSTDIVSDLAIQPTLSLDGKRVMYVTQPDVSHAELWVSDTDGSNKIKIASTKGALSLGDWSPDSTQLTYSNTLRDADENFVVNTDGSHPRQLPHSLATPKPWHGPGQARICSSVAINTGKLVSRCRPGDSALMARPRSFSPRVVGLPWTHLWMVSTCSPP